MSGGARQASETLEHKASLYGQLVHVYPEDARYLRRYAELLLQLGRDFQADGVIQRLQALLVEQGRAEEAGRLGELRRALTLQQPAHPRLTPFLHLLGRSRLDDLLAGHSRLELAEGEYLIRRGEECDTMYVVLEGELAVWIRAERDGSPRLVCLLEEGEIVGEMAFVGDGVRSADVLANRHSKLLRLSRRSVVRHLLDHPEAETALREEAAIRSRMLGMSRCDELGQLSTRLRRHLAGRARTRCFAPFERVFRAGDAVDEIGVVLAGLLRSVAEDHRGNSHVFDAYGPGSLIGVMALLHEGENMAGEPALTDLVAVERSELLLIPADVFRETMREAPSLRRTLMDQEARRISTTMGVIRNWQRRES